MSSSALSTTAAASVTSRAGTLPPISGAGFSRPITPLFPAPAIGERVRSSIAQHVLAHHTNRAILHPVALPPLNILPRKINNNTDSSLVSSSLPGCSSAAPVVNPSSSSAFSCAGLSSSQKAALLDLARKLSEFLQSPKVPADASSASLSSSVSETVAVATQNTSASAGSLAASSSSALSSTAVASVRIDVSRSISPFSAAATDSLASVSLPRAHTLQHYDRVLPVNLLSEKTNAETAAATSSASCTSSISSGVTSSISKAAIYASERDFLSFLSSPKLPANVSSANLSSGISEAFRVSTQTDSASAGSSAASSTSAPLLSSIASTTVLPSAAPLQPSINSNAPNPSSSVSSLSSSQASSSLASSVSEAAIPALTSTPEVIDKSEILKHANSCFSNGRYIEATEYYTKLLPPTPDSNSDLEVLKRRYPAYFNAANNSMTLGKGAEALKYLGLALNDTITCEKLIIQISYNLIFTTYEMGQLLFNRGLIYLKRRDFISSLSQFNQSYHQYRRYINLVYMSNYSESWKQQVVKIAEENMERSRLQSEHVEKIISPL